MPRPDDSTVFSLRQDLALQITRFVQRGGATQVAAARALAVPQPTLSRIMNGQVAETSLELLIKIAVRAGLPVILQTGSDPCEAGVYAACNPAPSRTTQSRLADRARQDLQADARRLTPEMRLQAQLRHSELLAELQQAGGRAPQKPRNPSRNRAP